MGCGEGVAKFFLLKNRYPDINPIVRQDSNIAALGNLYRLR